MDPTNRYTAMQRSFYEYEGQSGRMNADNHCFHNSNPDYWNTLVKDTEDPAFLDKVGLDFGCGCGRNVQNLVRRMKRMDGVDISQELVNTSRANLMRDGFDESKTRFYTCDGVSLRILESNTYDFVMSTIVLQHICVYEIRYNYLKEFYRVMKTGGILSFQMGYDSPPNSAYRDYFDNYYEATSTNSGCDTSVSSPFQIQRDLESIGFKNITYKIANAWCDSHAQWIFVRAEK